MKREPLADYRIYLTVDCINRRVVNTEHYDLRPVRGAGEDGKNPVEKRIIRPQDGDAGDKEKTK